MGTRLQLHDILTDIMAESIQHMLTAMYIFSRLRQFT